jgi:hypothetical protein
VPGSGNEVQKKPVASCGSNQGRGDQSTGCFAQYGKVKGRKRRQLISTRLGILNDSGQIEQLITVQCVLGQPMYVPGPAAFGDLN